MRVPFYILLPALSFVIISCGRIDNSREYRFERNGLVYYKNTDKPYTGVIFDSSSVILQYDVENGKKNGSFLVYYRNGMLAQSGYLINDKNEGEWRYYYSNGNLESRGIYKNDIPEGEWEFYYPNGKIKNRGIFKNGLRENIWYTFDKQEKLENIYYFKKGILVDYQIRTG